MFKEIFIGGRDVRRARQTIRELESRPSLGTRNAKRLRQAEKISRRHALKLGGEIGLLTAGALATGGAILRPWENNESSDSDESASVFPEQPFTEIPLPPTTIPHRSELKVGSEFDTRHVQELLVDLKVPLSLERSEALEALKENVVYIQFANKAGNIEGFGTGLRICESGYYLTAAHILLGEQFSPTKLKAQVYHPSSGRLSFGNNMVVDHSSDLATLHAPTGIDRKKAKNLQLSDAKLTEGQKLWLLGIQVGSDGSSLKLGVPFGTVDTSIERGGWNYLGEDVFTLVKDMIPFGGSSGGPIVDTDGRVVAVESAAFSNNPSRNGRLTRSDYTHAIVSSLANLQRLYDKPVIDISRNPQE
jgi:S1-C subfamily serine protease